MIPQFPKFKKLELSDKESIEQFTKKFPPYSDFNFISMWSWNIQDEMLISELHGNLVVRFTDYVSREPFYSFLGHNAVDETVQALLDLSKKEGLTPKLKLVPEESIQKLDKSKFKVEEDRDNFDYIYDIPKLSDMKGREYQTHRNLIRQFSKKYQFWKVKIVDFTEEATKSGILNLFKQWIKNKGEELLSKEYENELSALNRLLTVSDPFFLNLTCFAVYVDGVLIGFIINEHVNGYNIIHFEKADVNFKGAYPFLMQQNAKILGNFNLQYLNFEQDLGIDSLKFTKSKFQPSFFLKKYVVA